MSGIINKVKDALHSDKSHEQPTSATGTGISTTDTHTGGISHSPAAHTGAHPGGIGSTGSHSTAAHTGAHPGGIGSAGTHSDAAGLGSKGHTGHTGTHVGGVDSTATPSVGGIGTHSAGSIGSTGTHAGVGTTGYNEHNSKIANVADPRIDSDRDHRGAPGVAGTSHIGSGPGPAANTAGPHKSDMLNKVDPRVDSDLNGSKTVGGNKTYQQTANTSVAHKDPTDAAQVPPSVLREHVGDPDILHNDPHHGHDQRHGSVSHQEAHVVGKNI
ncbi:hypothetical protein DHEL01_v213032 [Diaporthe helianthi]|uniref:Cell surface protein n=1 Tax=Diaporthe helianthi TaxID=158607 RepID=A0A2P5HE88_DIAHE|nr:hypothetical protein DHEL01_v213032 [Diaporthe helianthi]